MTYQKCMNVIFVKGGIVLCSMCLAVFGCSSVKNQAMVNKKTSQLVYEMQAPVLVKTSETDMRPEWTKKTVFEDNGKVCFSGGYLNGSDFSLSVRCANAEALKAVLQGISQFIRSEFSSQAQGSNLESIDRYVMDGLASFSKNIHIQGIRQKEVYYEEIFSKSLMRPAYNVWVRLEIDNQDYLKAKAIALQRFSDSFTKLQPIEVKKRADIILEDLKAETRDGT